MSPFSHVISLGSDCRIAHNTRRFYGHGEGFPFDWWITPARSLILYAATGFDADALFDVAKLEEVRSSAGGIASIRHRVFGMRLHHEFQRENGGNYDVLSTWRDEIAERKRRHVYLIDKLRGVSAAANSLLFVRGSAGGDTEDDLASLTEAVGAVVPLARRQFLFVNYDLPKPAGSLALSVDDSAAQDWKGDPQRWDDALLASGIKLDMAGLKPYRGLSPEGERAGL